MAEITNYEIIRTKRRSMAIYVRDGGKIEVRCGMRTSPTDIEKFISEKEDWIKKAVACTSAEKRKICDGAKVLFLGNEYVISKKSISHGVSIYDRIVLDAEKYSLNQLIY